MLYTTFGDLGDDLLLLFLHVWTSALDMFKKGSVELRDVFLSVFLGFFLPEIYQFNRKNMARYFLMNADHRTLMDSQHDSAIKK